MTAAITIRTTTTLTNWAIIITLTSSQNENNKYHDMFVTAAIKTTGQKKAGDGEAA